jgi:hypothetical protein
MKEERNHLEARRKSVQNMFVKGLPQCVNWSFERYLGGFQVDKRNRVEMEE